jgi:DAACS family dicarboxylate/amino acid:cation (Na+ or H+) symporter
MSIVTLVARFAPIAVLCVMFDMTAVFGWTLLVHLSSYFSVVVAALCLHLLVVSAGLAWMAGDISPVQFLRSLRSVMVIAFTTSSSFSTLPAALHTAEQDLGLPARVARPTLGLGCVANQGGTIVYTTVTVIFLSQCFGMELTMWQQFMIFGLSILAGLGTMGVPAESLPLTAMLLALLHVPNEGIRSGHRNRPFAGHVPYRSQCRGRSGRCRGPAPQRRGTWARSQRASIGVTARSLAGLRSMMSHPWS